MPPTSHLATTPTQESLLIPAAEYVRMSTDHQKYSIENQQVAIGHYATENRFAIIQSYKDDGKSGLVLKERQGLVALLDDVISGKALFKAILVYDVSRWGRFQDIDEAAYYEFICKRAGHPIYYCAEPFQNDNSTMDAVVKNLKRAMAADFSRDLSHKVIVGQRAMTRRGFSCGGLPGYGLTRVLCSPTGEPKQLLRDGEKKYLKEDRTRIVQGPDEEVRCIREIYRMFIEGKRSTTFIANFLNARGSTRRGAVWNYQSVLKVLKNEKYAGSLVWGKRTQKLHTRNVPVPRDQWVIQPNVIDPIIDRKTFDKAQKARLERLPTHYSDAQLIGKLRRLFKTKGRLSAKIINEARGMPSAGYYEKRFGGLQRAYDLVHYERTDTVKVRKETWRTVTKLHGEVIRRLRNVFGSGLVVVRHDKKVRARLVRFSEGKLLSLVVCRFERTLRGSPRWRFQSTAAKRRGHATLLCRCNQSNDGIRDFWLMPSVAHLDISSLLQEKDARLLCGKKLNRLHELKTVLKATLIF